MNKPVVTITGTKDQIIEILGDGINDHIQQIMLSKEQEQLIINTITRQLNLHPTQSLTREQVVQIVSECSREFITASKLTKAIQPFIRRSEVESMLNNYELKTESATKWTKTNFISYMNTQPFKDFIRNIVNTTGEYQLTRIGHHDDLLAIYLWQMEQAVKHNKQPVYVEMRSGKPVLHPIVILDDDNTECWYQDWDDKGNPLPLAKGSTTELTEGEYLLA